MRRPFGALCHVVLADLAPSCLHCTQRFVTITFLFRNGYAFRAERGTVDDAFAFDTAFYQTFCRASSG